MRNPVYQVWCDGKVIKDYKSYRHLRDFLMHMARNLDIAQCHVRYVPDDRIIPVHFARTQNSYAWSAEESGGIPTGKHRQLKEGWQR